MQTNGCYNTWRNVLLCVHEYPHLVLLHANTDLKSNRDDIRLPLYLLAATAMVSHLHTQPKQYTFVRHEHVETPALETKCALMSHHTLHSLHAAFVRYVRGYESKSTYTRAEHRQSFLTASKKILQCLSQPHELCDDEDEDVDHGDHLVSTTNIQPLQDVENQLKVLMQVLEVSPQRANQLGQTSIQSHMIQYVASHSKNTLLLYMIACLFVNSQTNMHVQKRIAEIYSIQRSKTWTNIHQKNLTRDSGPLLVEHLVSEECQLDLGVHLSTLNSQHQKTESHIIEPKVCFTKAIRIDNDTCYLYNAHPFTIEHQKIRGHYILESATTLFRDAGTIHLAYDATLDCTTIGFHIKQNMLFPVRMQPNGSHVELQWLLETPQFKLKASKHKPRRDMQHRDKAIKRRRLYAPYPYQPKNLQIELHFVPIPLLSGRLVDRLKRIRTEAIGASFVDMYQEDGAWESIWTSPLVRDMILGSS